jgi:hypothetical protein
VSRTIVACATVPLAARKAASGLKETMATTAELSENSHHGIEGIKAALCLSELEANSNPESGGWRHVYDKTALAPVVAAKNGTQSWGWITSMLAITAALKADSGARKAPSPNL